MAIRPLAPRGSIVRNPYPVFPFCNDCTMAGLDANIPIPTDIKLHQQSRLMEIVFNNGRRFELPYEYLRVYSPSAEVRGHGTGQEVLQTGKKNVGIGEIEAVGRYAVQPTFTDGHSSGIYSWEYLFMLGERQEELWNQYLERLNEAGGSRE
jgi:DUF971 family protein